MTQKLLDALQSDMLSYTSPEDTVQVSLTLRLPVMLETLVDTIVNKLGGDKQKIYSMLVESMVNEQIQAKTKELLLGATNTPLPSGMENPLKDISSKLNMEDMSNTLNEFATKMQTLQGLMGTLGNLGVSNEPDNGNK